MPTIPTSFLMEFQQNPQHIVFKTYNSNGQIDCCERKNLLDEVSGFTQRFYALGVTKGSRIAILADPSLRLSSVVMAILSLGAIVVPIPLSMRALLHKEDSVFINELINKNCSYVILSEDQEALKLERLLDEAFEPVQVYSLDGTSEEVLPLFPAEVEAGFYERMVFLNDADSAALVLWEDDQVLTHKMLIESQFLCKDRTFSHGDCVWVSPSVMRHLGLELFLGALVGKHTVCLSTDKDDYSHLKPSIVLMGNSEIQDLYRRVLAHQSDISKMLYRWAAAVALKSERNKLDGLDSKRLRFQNILLDAFFKRMRDQIFEGVQWVGEFADNGDDVVSWVRGIKMTTASISKFSP